MLPKKCYWNKHQCDGSDDLNAFRKLKDGP